MWEQSEKHLALALLFGIAAQPITGWICALMLLLSVIHSGLSFYHALKED